MRRRAFTLIELLIVIISYRSACGHDDYFEH